MNKIPDEGMKKYVLMFGSGAPTNRTFTHNNSEVDIYYLNLFQSQKVANGGAQNGKVVQRKVKRKWRR